MKSGTTRRGVGYGGGQLGLLLLKLRTEGCDQLIRLSECPLGGQMLNLKVTHVAAQCAKRVGQIVNLA
eukprot:3002209-Prymnesium_polylepis.1